MIISYLTLEDLLSLAEDLSVASIRNLGPLDSAAHRPQTSLREEDAYASIHDEAAVLLESLTRMHALVDGDKRLSWLAVHVFHGLNGYDLDAPEDPAYDPEDACRTVRVGGFG